MKNLTNVECDALIKDVFHVQSGHVGVLYTQMVSLEELRTITRHAYYEGQKYSNQFIKENEHD